MHQLPVVLQIKQTSKDIFKFAAPTGSNAESARLSSREYPSTKLGRAFVASGFPLNHAHNFYRLLKGLRKNCCCTASPLHLLWVILEGSEEHIAITNWNLWVHVLQCTMPESHLEIAGASIHSIPSHTPHGLLSWICCRPASGWSEPF
jgi:hypothetical protein